LNAFVEVEDSGEEATHEKEKDAFSFIFSFFLSLLLKRLEKVRITPFKRHPANRDTVIDIVELFVNNR